MTFLPEPWRVKVVEPIRLPDPEERERRLAEAGLNLFLVPSEAVFHRPHHRLRHLRHVRPPGLANIGGFLATRDRELIEAVKQRMVVIEGFPTYGGLAGRDLEAVAVGLREVLDEDYQRYRVGQVAAFARALEGAGVPLVRPPGGHAVYLDARRFLPDVPPERFPAQALVVALYRAGAVRGVEIGSVMFGGADPETGDPIFAPMELVRLAVPRRVYTNSHLKYVVEVLEEVRDHRDRVRGLEITWQAPVLRHCTARFREV